LASTPPIGKSFAGRYTLLRRLGKGSMGAVWLAEDERLQREVAIKFLGSLRAGSKEASKRFAREAKAAAKFRSPHIVQIFDYGFEGPRPFIVMELLDGEDLQARLQRVGRFSLEDTINIILQACRALHVAHKGNIVHRDLKPANLMIDNSTGEELVKVLDFGVAKAVTTDYDQDGTKEGTLLGTPNYMAPEQARALPNVDHRADLWSLGVIAFRLLTGKPPFRASSVADMIVQICTAPIPVASELRPDLPFEIDSFFARALARDREKRFQSAREFALAFYQLQESSDPLMSLNSSFLSVDGPLS